MAETCELVDIRPSDVAKILEFAMENAVDLTIASDEQAIKADIATIFQENDQQIFAPSAQSAYAAISKSAGKRLFYKLHIPTPRFGIFEKSQLAIDYLKKCDYPVVIRKDETSAGADRQVCNSIRTASVFVEDLFLSLIHI